MSAAAAGIAELVRGGGVRQVYFAVTSGCDAECRFCGFRRSLPFRRRHVEAAVGERAIEHLAANHVGVISFTGGEPMLHPALDRFVARAVDLGMVCRTGTNGMRLDERRLDALRTAGLELMWFSIDSDDPRVHDRNRARDGLWDHLAHMRAYAESIGITVGAGVAISKLIGSYDLLLKRLEEAGYRQVTFAYPGEPMLSSYRANSDQAPDRFTQEELSAVLENILRLKERASGAMTVGNSAVALRQMIGRLRGTGGLSPCMAGNKLFYLDWDLLLYPCYSLPAIGPLFETPFPASPTGECDACTSQCFRDNSIYYHAIRDDAGAASLLAWVELLGSPYTPLRGAGR